MRLLLCLLSHRRQSTLTLNEDGRCSTIACQKGCPETMDSQMMTSGQWANALIERE